MTQSRTRHRGFTLVEMMVVIAVVGILCVLSYDAMRRARPRATFNSVSTELQSLVHAARQQALSTGGTVVVLVFTKYDNGQSTGRIVVVQDSKAADESILLETATLNLENYLPEKPTAPGANTAATRGQVIATLDLPRGVLFGPAGGSGQPSLPFPYDSITTNVACSFCDATTGKGAIVFDSRGRTSFYQTDGTTISASGQDGGASVSIYAPGLGSTDRSSTSTLVVTKPQGMLRSFQNG